MCGVKTLIGKTDTPKEQKNRQQVAQSKVGLEAGETTGYG